MWQLSAQEFVQQTASRISQSYRRALETNKARSRPCPDGGMRHPKAEPGPHAQMCYCPPNSLLVERNGQVQERAHEMQIFA